MTATGFSPKSLAIGFTVSTCLLSWSYLWATKAGLPPMPAWALPFVLMWIPGVVSITFRVAFREGFTDAGLRAGALRYWLLAYAIPFALATATYAAAWIFREVRITPYLRQ